VRLGGPGVTARSASSAANPDAHGAAPAEAGPVRPPGPTQQAVPGTRGPHRGPHCQAHSAFVSNLTAVRELSRLSESALVPLHSALIRGCVSLILLCAAFRIVRPSGSAADGERRCGIWTANAKSACGEAATTRIRRGSTGPEAQVATLMSVT
jgi:hypothetical protein